MTIDLSRCRLKPYDHQVVGIDRLVKWSDPSIGRVHGGCYFNTDEMGCGKTKQVIDAAQVLYTQHLIHRVVIVAPASVRDVWYDPELGELAKHLWHGVPAIVTLYHTRSHTWFWMDEEQRQRPPEGLKWVITNYDFIRNKQHLARLIKACDKQTWLVLDESSAVKNWRSAQTKACKKLRSHCGRVTELNGTPIANTPEDIYAQASILDKRILGYRDFFQYRAAYGVMGGWMKKAVVEWVNIDDLQEKMRPYVIRRIKSDCIDLPPKLPPVTIAVTLNDETWKIYRKMRDDMVAWLDTLTVSFAIQAGVKAMRLAQITSGFVGGVMEPGLDEDEPTVSTIANDRPDWLQARLGQANGGFKLPAGQQLDPLDPAILSHPNTRHLPPREIGREKLDAFIMWLKEQAIADPDLKLLVWCRFRPELARLITELEKIARVFPHGLELGQIHGGQKKEERTAALRLLDPRTMPSCATIVAGTQSSGSMGLNLTGARIAVYLSNDYSLKTRMQSEDRIHRPGQTYPVSYYDVVAQGPKGQKTVDHAVIKALREKRDLANMTVNGWRELLMEE